MAGPRDRSRHRVGERQIQYPLQDLQTTHRTPTAESSTVLGEDSYDDRDHSHPRNSGAQGSGRRVLGTYEERLAGALRACKERLAGFLRVSIEGIAKHRMKTILTASITCILFISGLWAFRNYGYDWSTMSGLAMGHAQPTITRTIYHSSTTYVTLTVHYNQFHGARPVHHQVPMAVPPNLEATGQVTSQGLSHPQIVTSTPVPVSGLYLIPISVTNEVRQDSHSSSRTASDTEGSQTLQGSASLEKLEPEAKRLLRSREIGAPRNLFAGQADADNTTFFTRWGVEVLYDLRRHSRRSISLYKGWCTKHACSPHKQLDSMCNTNKAISDSFRKQECEWCWPESQRKHEEIDHHCMKVSERALNVMFIICGILLFCTLVIAIVLATRMLRRKRRANADCILQNHPTTASPLREKTNNVSSHWFSHAMSKFGVCSKAAKTRDDDIAIEERSPSGLWYKSVFAKSGKRSGIGPENPAPSRLRLQKQRTKPFDQSIGGLHGRVPVLPPAAPTISSQVFSDIENMGQGKVQSGLGSDDSQHGRQTMPRRFSRQSRAVSSGSEQSSSEATRRRDAGAGLYNLQRLTERS